MAIDGLGVANLPEAMVETDLSAGNLQAIDYHWRPDDLSFFARFDAERAPSFVATAASLAGEIAPASNRRR